MDLVPQRRWRIVGAIVVALTLAACVPRAVRRGDRPQLTATSLLDTSAGTSSARSPETLASDSFVATSLARIGIALDLTNPSASRALRLADEAASLERTRYDADDVIPPACSFAEEVVRSITTDPTPAPEIAALRAITLKAASVGVSIRQGMLLADPRPPPPPCAVDLDTLNRALEATVNTCVAAGYGTRIALVCDAFRPRVFRPAPGDGPPANACGECDYDSVYAPNGTEYVLTRPTTLLYEDEWKLVERRLIRRLARFGIQVRPPELEEEARRRVRSSSRLGVGPTCDEASMLARVGGRPHPEARIDVTGHDVFVYIDREPSHRVFSTRVPRLEDVSAWLRAVDRLTVEPDPYGGEEAGGGFGMAATIEQRSAGVSPEFDVALATSLPRDTCHGKLASLPSFLLETDSTGRLIRLPMLDDLGRDVRDTTGTSIPTCVGEWLSSIRFPPLAGRLRVSLVEWPGSEDAFVGFRSDAPWGRLAWNDAFESMRRVWSCDAPVDGHAVTIRFGADGTPTSVVVTGGRSVRAVLSAFAARTSDFELATTPETQCVLDAIASSRVPCPLSTQHEFEVRGAIRSLL